MRASRACVAAALLALAACAMAASVVSEQNSVEPTTEEMAEVAAWSGDEGLLELSSNLERAFLDRKGSRKLAKLRAEKAKRLKACDKRAKRQSKKLAKASKKANKKLQREAKRAKKAAKRASAQPPQGSLSQAQAAQRHAAKVAAMQGNKQKRAEVKVQINKAREQQANAQVKAKEAAFNAANAAAAKNPKDGRLQAAKQKAQAELDQARKHAAQIHKREVKSEQRLARVTAVGNKKTQLAAARVVNASPNSPANRAARAQKKQAKLARRLNKHAKKAAKKLAKKQSKLARKTQNCKQRVHKWYAREVRRLNKRLALKAKARARGKGANRKALNRLRRFGRRIGRAARNTARKAKNALRRIGVGKKGNVNRAKAIAALAKQRMAGVRRVMTRVTAHAKRLHHRLQSLGKWLQKLNQTPMDAASKTAVQTGLKPDVAAVQLKMQKQKTRQERYKELRTQIGAPTIPVKDKLKLLVKLKNRALRLERATVAAVNAVELALAKLKRWLASFERKQNLAKVQQVAAKAAAARANAPVYVDPVSVRKAGQAVVAATKAAVGQFTPKIVGENAGKKKGQSAADIFPFGGYLKVELPDPPEIDITALGGTGKESVDPKVIHSAKTLNIKLKDHHKKFAKQHEKDCQGPWCPLAGAPPS